MCLKNLEQSKTDVLVRCMLLLNITNLDLDPLNKYMYMYIYAFLKDYIYTPIEPLP